MKTVIGNLVTLAEEGQFDVIVHGCNCFHVMGAGVALALRCRWPEVLLVDRMTRRGDMNKLGTYSTVSVKDRPLVILNAYVQYSYGTEIPHINYDAVRSVMKKIKQEFHGKRIGYPMIGAGLAGGNWDLISTIVDKELDGEDHTLVIYDQNNK